MFVVLQRVGESTDKSHKTSRTTTRRRSYSTSHWDTKRRSEFHQMSCCVWFQQNVLLLGSVVDADYKIRKLIFWMKLLLFWMKPPLSIAAQTDLTRTRWRRSYLRYFGFSFVGFIVSRPAALTEVFYYFVHSNTSPQHEPTVNSTTL